MGNKVKKMGRRAYKKWKRDFCVKLRERKKKKDSRINQAGDQEIYADSVETNPINLQIKIEVPETGYPEETVIFVTEPDNPLPLGEHGAGGDSDYEAGVDSNNTEIRIKAEPLDEIAPEETPKGTSVLEVFTHRVPTKKDNTQKSSQAKKAPNKVLKRPRSEKSLRPKELIKEALVFPISKLAKAPSQPVNEKLFTFIKNLPKPKLPLIPNDLPTIAPSLCVQELNISPSNDEGIVEKAAEVQCPKCKHKFNPNEQNVLEPLDNVST